jgi:HEPN domain-containing protein
VVFHAQQAIEKTLKGFLTWHGQVFRKTHNLVELGGACRAIAPQLDETLRKAAPLTEYAWKFRYPGDREQPSLNEARNALTLAAEVFREIAALMPPETRSAESTPRF